MDIPSMSQASTPRKEAPRRIRKGLIVVNTGDGKGKTTAALGVAFRAAGHGFKVSMIQFIKGGGWKPGEVRGASRLAPNFEIIPMGLGFTWLSKNLERDKAEAQKAWRLAKEKMASGQYNIVILDELTHAIAHGFVDLDDVVQTLKNKPEMLHVIVTGRKAPEKIIEIADLVTEMRLIKHPYENGVVAQRGIEF
jgi:cob(I)alamin adenosyltransferase